MNSKTVKEKALPKGWREVRLGSLCTKIVGGGTPSTAHPAYWKGKIPWMTSADIVDTKTIKPRRYITDQAIEQSATNLIPKDNIIVVTRVGLGKAVNNKIDICISQDSHGLLLKKFANPDFLIHSLIQEIQKIKATSQGSTIQGITKKLISNIEVLLPPSFEQKTIASLLETWDTAIEKTEALIAAKEKRFKWLLKTLISDQQNNPEWRKVKLGDIFGEQILVEKGRALTKKQMSKGDYPVVAGGQSYATFHNQFTHDSKTITISSSGAYAGFVWLHDYPVFATDCNIITAIGSKSIIEYFYYAIKIQQNRLYNLQSGGAQPHIYEKDIATLEILIPTVTQQRKVAHILDKARKEIDSLEGLVEQYQIQKRGLVQKLLAGDWRVKFNQGGYQNG